MNKKNITVIIPLHIYNDKVSELLNKAISSIPSDIENIFIITTKEINENGIYFEKESNRIKIIANETENYDFCSMVNYGVKNVDTDWFSILEYDDYYQNDWFNDANKYLYSEKDAMVYLPLVDLYDFNRFYNNIPRAYCGYANEAPWAQSFSNDLGYIDNESLQVYSNYHLTGAIFHTDTFKKIGMLKPKIKMTFWYEFLLRLTNKKYKVYVIPRVGYLHFIEREGSLSMNYTKEITEKEEIDYWLEAAKSESYYSEERDIKPFEKKQ